MSVDGAHSVRVELTGKDLQRLCAHRNKKLLTFLWVGLAGLTILSVAALVIGGKAYVLLVDWLPLFLLLLIWFALMIRVFTWALPVRPLMLPTLVTLNPDRFAFQNDVMNGTLDWRALKSVDDGKEHIFFLLERNQGYIIPKRCFITPEAARKFFDAARGYWQAARKQA